MTRLSARVAMAAWVWLAAGCGGPPAPQQARQAAEAGREIEALIEKLAISEAPAADAPVLTPSIDTPKADRRVIALDATEKLKAYGKAAFPCLLKHLDDKRQSMPTRAMQPFDVGTACWCIIDDQIFAVPPDYASFGFCRTGADGQEHTRPLCLGEGECMYGQGIASWLKAREDKSLAELQREALEWLIAQEKKIGFQKEEDEELYLRPLERRLELLK